MAGGLVALLDDIAALAKVAAASVDDVAAAAGRASAKAAGVVIDDAAVTPRYVVGLSPSRELPIIWKIALGSLRNKLLFILPAALAISAFVPWLLTPLLMIGGGYLCFEAAEKIIGTFSGGHHDKPVETITDPVELEQRQVSGAIRTDFILSAEIMAIALGELGTLSVTGRAVALAVVAIGITIAVYGAVALIVRMDDVGLRLTQTRSAALRSVGTNMVRAMPILLKALSHIGVAAMAWVGGGIILHGLGSFGLGAIPHFVHHLGEQAAHAVPVASGFVGWLVSAAASAILGLIVGGIVVGVMHLIPRKRAH